MSFIQELENVFRSIGIDVKDLRDRVGSLNSLTTEDKSSIVAALNELNGTIGQSIIDDSLESGNNRTYSIDKLKTTVDAAISILTDGTDDTNNTLLKLSNLVGQAVADLNNATDSIDDKVSYTAQNKDEDSKSVARLNIGAADARSVMASYVNTNHTTVYTGDVNSLPVGTFTVALVGVTGLSDEVLNGVGLPLGIMSISSSENSVSRVLVGSLGMALYSTSNPVWVVIGGSGSGGIYLDVTETYKVTLDMIGLELVTLPISNSVVFSKRLDVFCNGVLLMDNVYAVVDNQLVITIEDLGYALTEDDVICLKFKSI